MNEHTPGKRATILDVAEMAGVSHATVSRYLNGRAYVSADAGRAIREAVAEVGYVPNNTARALVRRKNFSAAFVVREHSDLFFEDPNLSAMAIGANATFSRFGYQMSILIVEGDASAARVTELVAGGAVDGAVLMAMQIDDPVVLALSQAGTPIITASSPLKGSSVPSVDTDNEGGARRIAQMLASTGRRTVAVINGPPEAPVSAARDAGYREGLGELYRPDLVEAASEWTTRAGHHAMRKLLERAPHLDGVVAASDALASGAIDALKSAGRDVPQDVGVVGFDDSSWAVRTQPQLSTVRQDARRTGIRMAELLLDQIDGEDLEGHHEVIPNEVIWRDSAGPIPGV